MHKASKAQKTPAADCRKRRVVLSILPHFLSLEDPLDDPLCFCYDVPRPSATHTECGYRQQYFCGKAHRGMVEYNGRQWGVT